MSTAQFVPKYTGTKSGGLDGPVGSRALSGLSRGGAAAHVRGKFLTLFELLSEVGPDLGRFEIQECPARLKMLHEELANGICCSASKDRHRYTPDSRPYERYQFQ